MQDLPHDGLVLIGRFRSFTEARYGPGHPSKANEVMNGLYRLVVVSGSPDTYEKEWRLDVREHDPATYERTAAIEMLEAGQFQPGQWVWAKVGPTTRKDSEYVNFNLIRIQALSAPLTAVSAAS